MDYFEVCWSIFSTICLVNVVFGILVCEITTFTVLAAVPIFSSAAGAIANGLCYYVYYEKHSVANEVVAAVFSDFFWLLQEASLLLYSYIILQRVLRPRQWRLFSIIFWGLMVCTAISRIFIAIYRAKFLIEGVHEYEVIINYLHIGYFTFMAISECLSAYFLVVIFASAKTSSMSAALKVGLLRYLTRSTEMRVAFLALIGVVRTIIHPFQTPGQKAVNIASQLDRFLYALFCLYPIVLYFDTLASKLRFNEDRSIYTHSDQAGNNARYGMNTTQTQTRCYTTKSNYASKMYGGNDVGNEGNNSQEQIVPPNGSTRSDISEVELQDIDVEGLVIRKTTEVTVT
ncbi:hypothetical protein FLAG1_10776 [Fusarium langsethiae]|uniref:Integral membrane protein n=1 Tax=Fusarium langsethiae TaxID=179993 RepID=A0A0N0V4Z1_FUSLA|nr:hypothetical protein FLAG1_10776 [Fusarium langsethiae]GKU07921.1 unnamed protein product [Fusarium langsethiae]GKU22802.1 unnamed protein product [Fusarium langsethiae]